MVGVLARAIPALSAASAILVTIGLAVAQNPTFQAETRIVEVAVVAKDGHDLPVTDLNINDFHVFDNGVEQKILSFEKLWDAPHAANGLPIGLPPNRPTIIVWNTFTTGWTQRFNVRDGIAKMLWNLPQTVDRIEILALGDELKTVHGFSPFTGVLRSATLEFDWQPAAMPRGNWQMWMLKALSNIARDMMNVRGEKNLLWIGGLSAGGSRSAELGGRGGFSLARSGAGPARGGADGGAPSPDYYPDMDRVMRELSAARVVFYPVGPSMMKPFELDEFARLTGGKAYWEDKDLTGLLRDAIDDSREGYLLSFTPGIYREDGSVHEVKLKTEREGVELRYRPAYVADRSVR